VKNKLLALVVGIMLSACTASPAAPTSTLQPKQPISTSTAGLQPANELWISPAVPDALRKDAQGWGLPLASVPSASALSLDFHAGLQQSGNLWIYALVAPFPTVIDGVTSDEIRQAWKGLASGPFAGRPLRMADSTLAAFTGLWGPPASGSVKTVPADQLQDTSWKNMPSWAIVPFEVLDPKWKVLTIDGQSPIHKDFNSSGYPLEVMFTLDGPGFSLPVAGLPASNRDASRLTTVIMTGTTALVREIAYQMEVHGINYPDTDIGDWLRQADIFHVSNETSFDPLCPPPDPNENRFYCSDPKYVGLFDDAGVDVVELTGNHILDNGADSMLYTLNLYKEHHMLYFGGGADLADARKPLLIENHGNKIAFLGCNAGEPPEPFATGSLPGANPCDYALITRQIGQLRNQGYLPIVTFQYKEGYSPQVMPWQEVDFQRVADAGAVIVSGSQSHVPLEMQFYKDTFIHYGLGNLFFGQMGNQPPGPGLPVQPAERYEFLDRHVFYDGRYISTELLTAMLEDYAQPRPMTADERGAILGAYFGYSGWLSLIPRPAPKQTPTLYPLLHFVPLPTHTPLPKGSPTP
jgi:poly-gamma-glutamate synthesis protein (capsule biosynthesis protein)